MTDINNKKDFKEINVVDNNLSINAVNNSILIDDNNSSTYGCLRPCR